MINYVQGDLFEYIKDKQNIIIPHICNDKGKWGAGFVIPLGKKFPKAKQSYLDWYESGYCVNSGLFKQGNVQLVCVDSKNGVWVANMISQTLYVTRPLSYYALDSCMFDIVSFVKATRSQIVAPKFGCGLAGGDWAIVEDMINKNWSDFNVTIVEFNKGD